MRVKGFIASLLLMACTQTGMAQRVILHLSNNQTVEYHAFEVDSITFKAAKDSHLISNLWDQIQAFMGNSKLNAYIWDKRPNVLFYNKNYVPAKGGENWDMYLKCFNAQIHEDDSAYIMVMPTDKAWDTAKQKLAPLYKYPNRYEDKVKGDKGEMYIRNINNPDSVANLSMEMDITSPLVFNQHEQPEDGSYLVTTYGDTLRSTPTWNMWSIFNGNRDDAGHGWCCAATEWAYPRELYNPDVEVEVDEKSFYNTSNTVTYYKVGADTKSVVINHPLFPEIADKYGHVSGNNFFYLAAPGPVANPHVEVKLTSEVMSGKYDVYVVMVPFWYSKITEDGFADSILSDQAFADSVSSITKQSFTAQIRYNNNATNGKDITSKKSAVIEYDGTKVDTLLLFEDFEFPYSYKNLRYTYPTLIIEGATRSAMVKQGFMYSLCIDRIILKSKETE